MTRRHYIYTICLLISVIILLIIDINIRSTHNTYYLTPTKSRKNAKIILTVGNEDDSFSQQRFIILSDETHVPTETEDLPVTNSYNSLDKTTPVILQHGTDDVSADVVNIVEKTQSKIEHDTSNFNFSQVGVQGLEDLVMMSGGQPLRSLIVSTWRSGSTFLGDLINNAVPSIYYHCEPLLMYGTKQFRTPKEATEALSIVKRMLKCDYKGLEDYFEFERKDLHGFSHSSRQWEYCKNEDKVDLCFNAEVTSRLCELFPFQNMKLVRLRLRLVEEILNDKTLNVRVILLIRDPRGVMQSRRDRPFCKLSSDCCEPSLVCADMVSDYVAAGRLLQQYPDRLMVMRFEELALQPNTTTERIQKFLKLDEKLAFDFLQSHTNVELAGPHSTSRVSRNVPFKWKTALDFNYVNEIQMKCRQALQLWGYKMAHNESHMKSEDFNPVDDYTIS